MLRARLDESTIATEYARNLGKPSEVDRLRALVSGLTRRLDSAVAELNARGLRQADGIAGAYALLENIGNRLSDTVRVVEGHTERMERLDERLKALEYDDGGSEPVANDGSAWCPAQTGHLSDASGPHGTFPHTCIVSGSHAVHSCRCAFAWISSPWVDATGSQSVSDAPERPGVLPDAPDAPSEPTAPAVSHSVDAAREVLDTMIGRYRASVYTHPVDAFSMRCILEDLHRTLGGGA